jgi:hypothetical protein
MLDDESFRSQASHAAKNLAGRLTWTDAAAKAVDAYTQRFPPKSDKGT